MRLIKQYTPAELAVLFKQAASGPVPGFNCPPRSATEAEQGQEKETAMYHAPAKVYADHLRNNPLPIIEAEFTEID